MVDQIILNFLKLKYKPIKSNNNGQRRIVKKYFTFVIMENITEADLKVGSIIKKVRGRHHATTVGKNYEIVRQRENKTLGFFHTFIFNDNGFLQEVTVLTNWEVVKV